MRFIEIKDGVSIDIDQIEVVERKEDLTSTVYTHHNVYETNINYNALLELLEKERTESEKAPINPFQQHWAG